MLTESPSPWHLQTPHTPAALPQSRPRLPSSELVGTLQLPPESPWITYPERTPSLVDRLPWPLVSIVMFAGYHHLRHLWLRAAASAKEALNIHLSSSMPPSSTGMPEKLRWRWDRAPDRGLPLNVPCSPSLHVWVDQVCPGCTAPLAHCELGLAPCIAEGWMDVMCSFISPCVM